MRAAWGNVTVPDRRDATDEQRPDEHHGERARTTVYHTVEHTDDPLVLREQARHGRRRYGVYAKKLARNEPRRAQGACQRHMDAMVVVRRQVERRKRSAFKAFRPLEPRHWSRGSGDVPSGER